MKKHLKILVMFCFTCSACYRSDKVSKECSLFNALVDDIANSDSTERVTLVKEYLNWQNGYGFNFPANELPKSEKERKERIDNEYDLIDPYPMLYAFAPPITDSLFSEDDRIFMREQANDSGRTSLINCKNIRVQFIEKVNHESKPYAFYRPIFSKDSNYAIVRMYARHTYHPDSKLNFGILQTLYYKQDKKGGWIRVFASKKYL